MWTSLPTLAVRTVHVPADRPRAGRPPFAWAYSTADALTLDGLTGWRDWSLPGVLYKLAGCNGSGYRRRGRTWLYLFVSTTAAMLGKFVDDGVSDPTTEDAQLGRVAEPKTLEARGAVSLKLTMCQPQRSKLLRGQSRWREK